MSYIKILLFVISPAIAHLTCERSFVRCLELRETYNSYCLDEDNNNKLCTYNCFKGSLVSKTCTDSLKCDSFKKQCDDGDIAWRSGVCESGENLCKYTCSILNGKYELRNCSLPRVVEDSFIFNSSNRLKSL